MGIIQAAGGLLWRLSGATWHIAIVHRPRYDDWTLPKGKLDKGESWIEAAVREVEEETHCQIRLGEFAGCSCYNVGGNPKIVLFWHMELTKEGSFLPNEETDELEWLPFSSALKKLSYAGEKEILKKAGEPKFK